MTVKNIHSFLLRHELLIIIITIAILLRIPSLFEPYWYGDEGIYLTLGQAIRSGEKLYKEIIDHKTPIIYWIAALSQTQFWFKFIFLWWNVASLVLFYRFALKLFAKIRIAAFSTLLFMLSTTLPAFEGNIANGELFVIGFVLVGANLFSETSIFERFMDMHKRVDKTVKDAQLLFLSGIFFSLGILTKVPALFDAAAFGFVFVLLFFQEFSLKGFSSLLKNSLAFIAGILFPILLSILFFWSQNSLVEYFQFGLLYNFRYSQSVPPPFSNVVVRFLFSFLGKTLFVGVITGCIIAFQKKLSPQHRFLTIWFLFALFASLLSSRPYPHYMLQVFPPIALALAMVMQKFSMKNITLSLLQPVLLFTILFLFHFGAYPIISYYNRFFLFISGKLSQQEYRQQFNWLMNDNYDAAKFIQQTTNPQEKMFIWGTNPMLYPLSRRVPTGRFTVAFHIKDFQAYEETMESIQQSKPTILVTMKDETGEFPAFYSYLKAQYVKAKELPTMTLYRRISEE